MENLYLEASLADSKIYKSFNNNSEMTSAILSAIKDSITIDESYISEQILQIDRTKISPLVDKVMEAYRNGNIMILYSKSKRISKVIPFFVTKIKGQIKSIIFANNFGTISKSEKNSSEKYLNISMKDLYALLEGAYVAREYTLSLGNTYSGGISKSLGLMKIVVSVYTNMVLRILNKEYAISLDIPTYQKVTFCIAKYFMERVWLYPNPDVVFTYAKNTILGLQLNPSELTNLSDIYDNAKIEDISDLITFLEKEFPRLHGMSFRYFLQCYINTYKSSALLGLECLPYFLFTVQASMIGSFLINQTIISDITKTTKQMNHFYPELSRAL